MLILIVKDDSVVNNEDMVMIDSLIYFILNTNSCVFYKLQEWNIKSTLIDDNKYMRMRKFRCKLMGKIK